MGGKTASAAAEARPSTSEPVTKRVHVGNLAPSVTAKDLVQRFSSFGTVIDGEHGVQGLGKTDTGTARAFAFFSLETTDAQFARCMSMLNGSTWKAHKLRIGPAKPDWQSRLAAEREAAIAASEGNGSSAAGSGRPKKRRKRSKDPNVGVAATHFELVDKDNIQRHRGWLLDPKPVPTPLFPIIIRPSHPVGPPPAAPTTAWTRAPTKAKPSKAARAAARLGSAGALERPSITRAKRMRIDPRRWGRQKIVFDLMMAAPEGKGHRTTAAGAGAGAPNMHAIGTWECEEPEEGTPAAVDNKEQVTWVFKTRDGQVRRRETVRLTQRTAHTDRFTTLLERLHQSSTAPAQLMKGDDSAAVAGDQDDSATMNDDATPTIADNSVPPAPDTTRARSLSPPPYVPIAPRTLIYNEEDEFQLVATALNDDERALAHARERAEYRKLALSALAEIQDLDQVEVASTSEAAAAVEEATTNSKPLPRVEGFARADDDDDDDEIFEALRLRGGAGGEASDSSSDEDEESSSSSSSSDSGSSSESDSDEASQRVDTAAVAASNTQDPAALKETLTALFKPGSAAGAAAAPTATDGGGGGFSLFADMDLDLDGEAELADEGVAIPLAPPIDTVPVTRPLPSLGMGPTRNVSRYGPQVSSGLGLGGPSKPFFLFPSGPFEDANRPGEVDEVEVAKLGLPAVSIERAKDESRRRVQDAPASNFWRHESQDEIDENHLKMRETLRGVARKRHREAVKRTRKPGGPGRRGATSIPLDLLEE